MRTKFVLFLLGVLGVSAFTFAESHFEISYWCGPPPRFNTLERVREIKDAGFTIAMNVGGAGYTVQQNRQMLDYCQQVGLKAMIADGRMQLGAASAEQKKQLDAMIKDYSDHPALFGYFICDEPGAGAYPGLGQVTAYLKEKDPKHPGYINLLPNWAKDLGVLGTPTYDQYVRDFVEKVKPFAISYDNYSMTKVGDRAGWFENLDTVRKVGLDTKTPFWNIVLIVEHGGYRNLTEPELRLEAMQTLAFGGQGLVWFTYWSPAETDNSAKWEHAMINPDGTRDPHYDMAKRINADVKAIGDLLVNAKSTGVFQVGGKPEVSTKPVGGITPSASGEFTIGVFKASDGKTLALVTNRDYKQPLKNARITIQPPSAKVEQFDPAKKSWSPAVCPDPGEGDWLIDLPAGGGVLLRW